MMNLDKRIPQGFSEPFSILRYEGARQYEGELCWFSNNARDFTNIDSCTLAYLRYVDLYNGLSDERIFECEYEDNKYFFRYCIPCSLETSYRPFRGMDELHKLGYTMGKVITWRVKGTKKEITSMITLIENYGSPFSPVDCRIKLGDNIPNLESAYRTYELKVDNKWIPFGVKKDD